MWKHLTPLLKAAGHEVYAPTMTGMAERAHELTADVGLDRHVQDIVDVLYYEDLRDVVLVGHSYGGMVIAGVAEKAPERLSHLIYLDAFLPEDGKALRDYAPVPTARADGWRIPPIPLVFKDEQVGAWAGARFTDQPIATFKQTLRISPDRTRALAKTYILTSPGSGWFADAAARAKGDGFTTRSFTWEHEAVLEQAAPVAKIILDVV
jgi:pimeloyl-ACP methyl ester carboxylesterase